MKKDFIKALHVFKYVFIVFSIIYWVYIVIDDWVFIEKYWPENWLMSIGLWALYFLVYSLILSFYFWVIASLFIVIRRKIKKAS